MMYLEWTRRTQEGYQSINGSDANGASLGGFEVAVEDEMADRATIAQPLRHQLHPLVPQIIVAQIQFRDVFDLTPNGVNHFSTNQREFILSLCSLSLFLLYIRKR